MLLACVVFDGATQAEDGGLAEPASVRVAADAMAHDLALSPERIDRTQFLDPPRARIVATFTTDEWLRTETRLPTRRRVFGEKGARFSFEKLSFRE